MCKHHHFGTFKSSQISPNCTVEFSKPTDISLKIRLLMFSNKIAGKQNSVRHSASVNHRQGIKQILQHISFGIHSSIVVYFIFFFEWYCYCAKKD